MWPVSTPSPFETVPGPVTEESFPDLYALDGDRYKEDHPQSPLGLSTEGPSHCRRPVMPSSLPKSRHRRNP